MATKVFFGGKTIFEPGVFAQTLSGIKTPPQPTDFGTVLIIDTGSGAGFGAGSGIDGELLNGREAIERSFYDNNDDFREQIRGGLWWLMAQPLFRPLAVGINGVSGIYYIKAATTTAATLNYVFTGGGANGGSLTIKYRNEGVVGNGAEIAGNITRGFGARMVQDPLVTTRFALEFYIGTFRGTDNAISTGDPYDGIAEEDTAEQLIARSPYFDNIETFINWANTDPQFNRYFALSASAITGTGAVDAADLAANVANNLATGGTETYSTTLLDQVLDAVDDLDYTYILSDQYEANAGSVDNFKILDHILNQATFEKFLVVAGGRTEAEFQAPGGSIPTAQLYNSDRVMLIHGGVKIRSNITGDGLKDYGSIYKAALYLGRRAGLQPQDSVTFKSLAMDGDQHVMSAAQRELALDSGVIHTKQVQNEWEVNQDINTLQLNSLVVNEDGTSHQVTVKTISSLLNKEIVILSRRDLFKKEAGPNRNTVRPADVQAWIDAYLTSRTADENSDNLILYFEGVSVAIEQDAYRVTYRFEPNFEVNKLLVTGFIIDRTITQ